MAIVIGSSSDLGPRPGQSASRCRPPSLDYKPGPPVGLADWRHHIAPVAYQPPVVKAKDDRTTRPGRTTRKRLDFSI